MKYVTEVIERLQNRCGICWCLGRGKDVWHEAEDCPRAEFFLGVFQVGKRTMCMGKISMLPGHCPTRHDGLSIGSLG